jgi:hypothetical protein
VGAQTKAGREIIEAFDCQFARLHSQSCSLVRRTPIETLYLNRQPNQPSAAIPGSYSTGENVLRGAAAVEQTFGGITANLWDDPFEWTLPENLATTERVIEYLEEVEATRQRAFARFAQDADLLKEVLVPAGNTRPLVDLLAETLVKAADYQGRAISTLVLPAGERAASSSDRSVPLGSNANESSE